MFDSVDQALALLEKALQRLEPEALDPCDSKRLFEKFVKIERLGAAGKALTSRRVADSGVWHNTGFRSPAHYMADVAKSTVGHAVYVLETAESLRELPSTEQAFREGKLAEIQAIDLVQAAVCRPASQEELLEVAQHKALIDLRRQCARVRASSMSAEERHHRIHRNRQLRHWMDVEGAFRLDGRFTPEAGAVLLAALAPLQTEVARRAAKHGVKETASAHAADALVEMAERVRCVPEDAFRTAPGAVVHVRMDHAALVRGHTDEGEVCEIAGVGPIPVEVARSMMADAFVAAIVTDGQDVLSVSHLGRTVHSRVRTALWERDQGCCVVPGCNDDGPLAIDHISEYRHGGPTELQNLCLLCKWHHYLKTHHGYKIKRLKGSWIWEGPNGQPPDEEAPQPELPVIKGRTWSQYRLGPPKPKRKRRRPPKPQQYF